MKIRYTCTIKHGISCKHKNLCCLSCNDFLDFGCRTECMRAKYDLEKSAEDCPHAKEEEDGKF